MWFNCMADAFEVRRRALQLILDDALPTYFARMCEAVEEGEPFPEAEAADALRCLSEFSRELGRDVVIPADFAELLSRHLAGEIRRKPGQRRAFDRPGPGHSYMEQRVALAQFDALRADGWPYEAAVADVIEGGNISRKTIEKWITLRNKRNS